MFTPDNDRVETMTINDVTYTVERELVYGMWSIKTDLPGPVPKPLQGQYTNLDQARRAIEAFSKDYVRPAKKLITPPTKKNTKQDDLFSNE